MSITIIYIFHNFEYFIKWKFCDNAYQPFPFLNHTLVLEYK